MITLKPTIRYWLMTNLIWIVIVSLLLVVVQLFEFVFFLRFLLGFVALFLTCLVFWNYVVLYNITYIIDTEQILLKRGVFNRTTDYLEMYRVRDYQKKQNIVEVVFGLMNVLLITRDPLHPTIIFIGISNNDDLIPVIRERVERERQRKGILEFNNNLNI